MSRALEEEVSLLQVLPLEGRDQMEQLRRELPEWLRKQWFPQVRRWMRRLHQARRGARGCAEGDALESQSLHHDRRRMLERVNLRVMKMKILAMNLCTT
jgi:hypothetical protein